MALVKAYSVKMANVQCNNSIRSSKETPFSWRTNEDKLTTTQVGLPRPNVSIQQVATKGGDPTSKNWNERKSWLAGCEVANAVCISIYHCHFS